MEASVIFLLRWRGHIIEETNNWVQDYLNLFNCFIQPGVSFENLKALNFSILKSEKTSRKKIFFDLPINMVTEEMGDDPEVVTVTKKAED